MTSVNFTTVQWRLERWKTCWQRAFWGVCTNLSVAKTPFARNINNLENGNVASLHDLNKTILVDSPAEDCKDELTSVILSLMLHGFERFCQRILRESGSPKIELTRRSGYGRIDGVGVLRTPLRRAVVQRIMVSGATCGL